MGPVYQCGSDPLAPLLGNFEAWLSWSAQQLCRHCSVCTSVCTNVHLHPCHTSGNFDEVAPKSFLHPNGQIAVDYGRLVTLLFALRQVLAAVGRDWVLLAFPNDKRTPWWSSTCGQHSQYFLTAGLFNATSSFVGRAPTCFHLCRMERSGSALCSCASFSFENASSQFTRGVSNNSAAALFSSPAPRLSITCSSVAHSMLLTASGTTSSTSSSNLSQWSCSFWQCLHPPHGRFETLFPAW